MVLELFMKSYVAHSLFFFCSLSFFSFFLVYLFYLLSAWVKQCKKHLLLLTNNQCKAFFISIPTRRHNLFLLSLILRTLWSRSTITTLSAKNKVEFVYENALQLATTDASYSSRNRCNNIVVSWIVHSVSIPIKMSNE